MHLRPPFYLNINLFVFHLQVIWEPFTELRLGHLQLSYVCDADEDLYMMSNCPLICFYAVEFHLPH